MFTPYLLHLKNSKANTFVLKSISSRVHGIPFELPNGVLRKVFFCTEKFFYKLLFLFPFVLVVRKMYFKNGIQIQIVLILLYVTHLTSACRSQGIDKRSTKCILPPYPKHGSYEVAGDPAAKPGDELEYVYLNVSCERGQYGHAVIGNNIVLCILGEWSTTMPECVPVCYLQEHPSVTYSCNSLGAEEFGACGEYEPLGASVKAECRPGYYSPEALHRMRCVNGIWTYVAQCTPAVCYLQEHPSVTYSCNSLGAEEFGACGEYEPLGALVKADCRPGYYSPEALPRMRCVNGIWTNAAQCTPECGLMSNNTLPWHAHIYRKEEKSIGKYQPTCGGTIISPNIVVSAAHCFWHQTEEVKTSEDVVVAGKKYWGDISEGEKFPVAEVKVPVLFQGALGNYGHDIALVILSKAFTYSRKLHPVCLNFNYEFKKKQMQEGSLGTLGLFPFPMVDQSLLQVSKISYLPDEKCITRVPLSLINMITGDKFCAEQINGTLICRGNSGSGLAFPGDQRGITRYYLQGIVSAAPPTERICTPMYLLALTEVYFHKDFIKEHLATSLPPRMMGWLEPEGFDNDWRL